MKAEAMPVTAPGSPDWHDQRRTGIGGSDASAIMGLNPYRSRRDVWLEKVGQITDTDSPSEAAHWGTVLEPLVADALEDRLRSDVDPEMCLVPARATVRSTSHPFMLANLDRWVLDGEGVTQTFAEIKTVGLRSAKEWAEPNGIAPHALLQCMHYMLVTGFDYCYVGVLIGGQEFGYRVLEAHEGLMSALVTAEKEFWGYVERQEPPPLDATEPPAALWPQAEQGKAVVLDGRDDVLDLVGRYRDLTQQMGELKAQRDNTRRMLEVLMEDAEVAVLDDKPVVRWSNVSTDRLDTTALKRAHPVLAQQFTKTTTSRRFTVV